MMRTDSGRPPGILALLLVAVLLFGTMPFERTVDAMPIPRATYFAEQALALRQGSQAQVDLSAFPSYRIHADLDLTSATIQATERVDLLNPSNRPLSDVAFRLLPNASHIYGGGSMSVTRVAREGVESVRWMYSEDRTVLTVVLNPPLAVDDMVALELEFVADIPRSSAGYAIFHHSESITSLSGWYPVLAPYASGWETPAIPAVGDANHFPAGLYEVTITAPSTHALVSTGITVDRRSIGGKSEWRLVSGPARGFALALSDRFQVQTSEHEGVTLNYYALPGPRGARPPEEAFRIAVDSFVVYDRRFGPYPYTEFDVVETPVTVGGYEFAGMVFVQHAIRTGASTGQLRFIVAHETAHQWWYALVGSDPVHEPWLDESLATYSVAIYAEDALGPQAGDSMLAYFASEAGSPSGTAPGIDVSALDYVTWVAYRTSVYYQGAMFLHALRRELGDASFMDLLRGYAEDHRFGIATTQDLIGAARRTAVEPLDAILLRWFGTTDPGV